MLDERLVGLTFTLPDAKQTGVINFFGIRYHYQVQGAASPGLCVIITAVTPLALIVTAHHNILDY
ncbi:hypothetical protein [Latilactobacillus graminis]|uniref:Uncharacterized protein n=2 Tax=Latilactobacillus graminis TaxID=60519 RepID=A0AA89L3C9_9LACO|nr:hypothetical protein [Latilactobacillus graminis]KRM21000.1 hypothetical protein FC90_GL001533 [Latilactobacillus graminis DSM 20719]QFP79138.1 hypothetical protein LG542_02345 [Latilactobacillus graminis]